MSSRGILICRTGAMGDVLHALPAVSALRRARPQWHIGWVVDPRWTSLLDAPAPSDSGHLPSTPDRAPMLDRVHLAETRLWSQDPFSLTTLRSIGSLRKELRQERYDLVVDLQGTLRSAVIARLSGAQARAGFADPRERVATTLYTRLVARQGAHVVEQNAALLGEACGLTLQPEPPSLPHAAWADEWAAELVGKQRICVLSPSAGWGAKRWPAARFGALAQMLHGLGLSVRVNASRADDALAHEVVAASQGAAEAVVCNVAGLTALLRRTTLLVGGDSGPMHLAAALSVPLVALFGPTDPARNGPWGRGPRIVLRDASSRTSYQRTQQADPGLTRISVAAVWDAVRQLI